MNDILLENYLKSKIKEEASYDFKLNLLELIYNQFEYFKMGMYLSEDAKKIIPVLTYHKLFNQDRWINYDPDKGNGNIKSYFTELIKRLLSNNLINYYSRR